MPIPDFQSLMLPLLRVSAGGEIRVSSAVDRLADDLRLSSEERTELLASGKQTIFSNRVAWAKLHLSKANLIENTRRAYFVVSPRGQEILARQPSRIDLNFLGQFAEYRSFREGLYKPEDISMVAATASQTESDQTPHEAIRAAYRQLENSLAQELLERVRLSPPAFFERLLVSLLLAMGYGGGRASEVGRALGGPGDNGVDGVIDQDALGLDRVYIQAKRYAADNKIAAVEIRDFFDSLDRHKASKGLFVTTSAFSNAAKETAKHLSKRIVLIDGDRLASLMVQHNIGCRIEDTLHVRKLDEEFFES